jgi:plasmid stability protein
MATSITIRDVPNDVRDELAARAARTGRSLQQYLRAELIQLASRPSVEDLLARAQARIDATGSSLSAENILAYREADRE